MSILIVDDGPEDRYLLRVVLENKGYAVIEAANGDEALAYAKETKPELVVSDILMPVMDGFKLCRAWKADPNLCRIPFVFYTATDTEFADRELALDLGADRFIVKPVEYNYLIQELIQAMQVSRIGDEQLQSLAMSNESFYAKYSNSLVRKLEHSVDALQLKNIILQKKEAELCELKRELELCLDKNNMTTHAALQVNEERFDLVAKGSSSGIWDWNIETDDIYYSTQFCKLLGVELCNKYGKSFFGSRIHPEDIESTKNALIIHLRDRKPFDLELRLQTNHDGYHWFHVCGQALWDNNNNRALRMAGSISDINARKKMYKKLQQAQKIEAIGELTGGIAHDFNNILAAVLGYTQMSIELCSECESNNKLNGYLNEILSAGNRARDFIAQMLAYSRGCENKPQLLEVVPQIKEILKMLRASIPTTIEIVYDFEKNIPTIIFDPVHLHQLVINLCVNARDALDGRGTISLRVSKGYYLQKQCASCNKIVGNEYLELAVVDEAGGIKADLVPKIFNTFFTTKEEGKGTGMGLSIVQSIMHEYGGHVLLDTKAGIGSTFRLLFPYVNEKKSKIEDENQCVVEGLFE